MWRARRDDYTRPSVSGHPAFIASLIIPLCGVVICLCLYAVAVSGSTFESVAVACNLKFFLNFSLSKVSLV